MIFNETTWILAMWNAMFQKERLRPWLVERPWRIFTVEEDSSKLIGGSVAICWAIAMFSSKPWYLIDLTGNLTVVSDLLNRLAIFSS